MGFRLQASNVAGGSVGRSVTETDLSLSFEFVERRLRLRGERRGRVSRLVFIVPACEVSLFFWVWWIPLVRLALCALFDDSPG
jgi:hypothetical protein